MLQKWRHNNGSTVFMLISAKTKRDLLCEQKSMATWQQQNLGTITDTLSWYKFSPLGGIRVKPKLHMRRRRIYESLEKPSQKPKVIHTYNLWKFGKYCEESSWNHRATTLHRSETSGIAERAVRRQKEETSAVLLQSGSDDKWRSDSMECYCCLRDDQDLLADGKSQNERRYGASFLWHALFAGWIWEEDILIAEIEELEKLDASEIYPRRLIAKEVLTTQKVGEFVFPVADGSSKLSGRNYEFQEPTLRRESTVKRENLSGESHDDREEFRPEE